MKDKNNIKKLFLMLGFSLFVSAFMYSQSEVGRIAYLEGIVDIHRDGEIIELYESDIGMEVYNQDLIETDSDGYLEVEMTSYRNSGTMVIVSPDTAFYFDASGGSSRSKNTLPLLAGSLSLRSPGLREAKSLMSDQLRCNGGQGN